MMKLRLLSLLVIGLVLLSSWVAGGLTAPAGTLSAVIAADLVRGEVMRDARSAALFIENVGQFPEEARFRVWGGGYDLWLAEDAFWMTVVKRPHFSPFSNLEREQSTRDEAGEGLRGVNLRFSFVGANHHPRLEPLHRQETRVSYFIGNDPGQWYPDVPVWGGVRYKDLYPGIDLELRGQGRQLVQRMVAHRGADLSAVRLRVEGADLLTVAGERLVFTTAVGKFTMPLLTVVTEGGTSAALEGERELRGNEIAVPFVVAATVEVSASLLSADVGASDLLYATFLGGSGSDTGHSIAADGTGQAYVVGDTGSSDFPTTPGAFDTYNVDWQGDAFVAKLGASGSALVYATFLGGSGGDSAKSIAVDGAGNAYITGCTCSGNFPTTSGAIDASYNGNYDAFVAKLNATGSNLVYATFLGGSDWDEGDGVVVDVGGSAYVTGVTHSSNFRTTPGAFDQVRAGQGDVFLAKLNARGSSLVYSTFVGGTGQDHGWDLAIDEQGNAYVTGETSSSDFPTTSASFDRTFSGGDYDAFVVKLNTTGSALMYGTFLGGSNGDVGGSISVDGAGNANVTGATGSSDFPITAGALDRTFNGGSDVFVVKLNAMGSALLYSTLLGGGGEEESNGISVSGTGNTYVTGSTSSSDFPSTDGAFDRSFNGGEWDVFVAKLDATCSSLVYATFLGGGDDDRGSDIAVDRTGNAYVIGLTGSSDFPISPGAFDHTLGGVTDVFVAKLAVRERSTPTPTCTATPAATPTATPLHCPEPANNSREGACGPMMPNVVYCYHIWDANDPFDWFYFDMARWHTIEAWLTNIASGCDYDLYLRDANGDHIATSPNSGNADEHILWGPVGAGRYYLVVVSIDHTWSASVPYALRASFGQAAVPTSTPTLGPYRVYLPVIVKGRSLG